MINRLKISVLFDVTVGKNKHTVSASNMTEMHLKPHRSNIHGSDTGELFHKL